MCIISTDVAYILQLRLGKKREFCVTVGPVVYDGIGLYGRYTHSIQTGSGRCATYMY